MANFVDPLLAAVKWLFKLAADDTRLIGLKRENLPDPPVFDDSDTKPSRGGLRWTLAPFWEANA